MKHLWSILVGSPDSTWVTWVCTHIIKGRYLWVINPPSRCSWIMRSLLSLRHIMCPLVAWRMGDGSQISFWHDTWSPCCPLSRRIEISSINTAGLNLNQSVRDFYSSSTWAGFLENKQDKMTTELRPLYLRLTEFIPCILGLRPGVTDHPIWLPSPAGKFSIRTAWKATRTPH